MRRRRAGDGDDRRAPALNAEAVAREWGLDLGEPFALSRHSLVAPAGDAVLKLVPSEDDESAEEAEALELWNGEGAVRLLRHDRSRRALLLERARPGTDLSTVSEEDATEAAVVLGSRLWTRGQSPGLSPFRCVHDHVPRWLANAADHPLVPLAARLYAGLEKRSGTLVHGDFHHHNILRSAAFVAAGLDEERIRLWPLIRGAYLQPGLADSLRQLL